MRVLAVAAVRGGFMFESGIMGAAVLQQPRLIEGMESAPAPAPAVGSLGDDDDAPLPDPNPTACRQKTQKKQTNTKRPGERSKICVFVGKALLGKVRGCYVHRIKIMTD